MSKMIDFMRLCLQEREVPLSWGISNIIVSKGIVTFDVAASTYQGKIIITEKGEEISIKLKGRTRTFISSKELLAWLDSSIE